jgi:thiol-disulfide isomerase/thioredoxin
MKKKLGKILLLIPLVLVILFALATLKRQANAKEAAYRIQTLPDLVITDLNGNLYTTSGLKRGPLLIAFFHPECDHCRYELSSLVADGSLNKEFEFLFISYDSKEKIRSFIQELGIPENTNVHVLLDTEFMLRDLFGATVIPANFIYDDSLHLVKAFKGSVKPETIMKYLNDSY